MSCVLCNGRGYVGAQRCIACNYDDGRVSQRADRSASREYLRRYAKESRKYWTSVSLRIPDMTPGLQYVDHVQPERPFRMRWVVVTTPGFRIVRAEVRNVIFIDDSATDLYYVGHWDELERLGQLDRVRVDAQVCDVGNNIRFHVMNEGPRLATFEVGMIGESVDAYQTPAHVLYRDEVPLSTRPTEPPPTIVAGDAGPTGRYCSECGAPVGSPCHGTKRGTFHKRREKVKP